MRGVRREETELCAFVSSALMKVSDNLKAPVALPLEK
jgi:hypothetical protein